MKNATYKITLSDGTVLDDLKMNGNNFISNIEIDAAAFEGNCSKITINDGEKDEIYSNVELVQIMKIENEYWFVLRQIPKSEREFTKMQSDLEYVAMMSEIDL